MKIGKKILIAVLTTILVLLFAWIGSAAYSGWQGYRWQKQTDKFQEALRRPYKEDTYGGKTPEETWAMFLEALKKGDVELASKYFVVEKQGERGQDLQLAKNKNRLEEIIQKFSPKLEKESSNYAEIGKVRYIIPITKIV